VSGKVARVHRRDVSGAERLHRLDVVPVVEMTPEPLETRHSGQCCRGPLDQVRGGDVAEVMRSEIREQLKADVGR